VKKAGIAILFICFSFGLCLAETPGAGSAEPGSQDKVDQLQKAIAETTDDAKKAAFYKELGEFYASKEDYKKAADEYLKALSLFPGFPEKEKYKMALHISWAGRTEDAVRILRKILEDNPDNVEARIHLARLLNWSAKSDEAYEQIETVLKAHPDNRDALQVKAAILNSMGRRKESIAMSRKLLEEKEDFDTRLGLSYALLWMRNIQEAEKISNLLKPEYPYQQKELGKFSEELNKIVRPRYALQYAYYEDSDKNVLNRYRFSVGKYIGNCDFTLNYLFTSARDRTRHNRDHDIMAETACPLTESLLLGLGAGANQTDATKHETQFIGYAKMDQKIPGGSLGLTVNRYEIADTAQLIENHITAVRTGVYASKTLVGRLSLYGSYNFSYYSDNNNSNDVVVAPNYTLHAGNPVINMGYTFRYVGFRRQSGSGYYDPGLIISNQLSLYFSYEKPKFYMIFSPYAGYQTTRRDEEHGNDFFGGGYAVLGYRIINALALEAFADAGNGALSTTGGWRYYQAGVRLKGTL
jgi:tetratricopeptide (TPR) repeat protein